MFRFIRQMCTLIFCFALSLSVSFAASEKIIATNDASQPADNHFRTDDDYLQSPQPIDAPAHPLQAYPYTQYVVHGVVVSADNAVAVVYTPDHTWHRLQRHAQIGLEQASIKQITTEGIQLEHQGSLLWLPVLQ